jgi:hypothetical protein
MENDFYEFAAKRCEKALLDCPEYMNLEHNEDTQENLQEIAEIICYRQGFKDAMKLSK